MTTTAYSLAAAAGWSADDVICTAGPHDRPFEERHDGICIAAVTEGTFRYRSSQGASLLAPGSVLLGNDGQCFECGHEHAQGDRCIAFHFAPDYFESIVAAVPGARKIDFALARLPPLPSLLPLLALLEVAREEKSSAVWEEAAVGLAGRVVAVLVGQDLSDMRLEARHARRITAALRHIVAAAHEGADDSLSLSALAAEAAMSPYHFLRAFQKMIGMTPHQFLLHRRLHRAAVMLRLSDEPVISVALAAGFDDLSTFNRRFRRIAGMTPSAFRKRKIPVSSLWPASAGRSPSS